MQIARIFLVGFLTLSLTGSLAAGGLCASDCAAFMGACARMSSLPVLGDAGLDEAEPSPEPSTTKPSCHEAISPGAIGGEPSKSGEESLSAQPALADKLSSRDCCSLDAHDSTPPPALRSLLPEAPQAPSALAASMTLVGETAPIAHPRPSPSAPPGDPPGLRLLLHQAFLL